MAQATEKSLPSLWEEFFDLYAREDLHELAAQPGDLEISFSDLEHFSVDLADELVEKPDRVLRAADMALGDVDLKVDLPHEDIEIQIVELPAEHTHLARDLRSEHIGRLIAVEGLVRKVTEVRPKVAMAAFECQRCGEVQRIEQDQSEFEEPYICRGCERKGPFELLQNESMFHDSQKLQLQEAPEELSGGQQPQSIDIYVRGNLAGDVSPGNRVQVNGVLRSYQRRNRGQKRTIFDIFLEGNAIQIEDQEFEELEISEEEKEEIEELADDPAVYGKIIDSIAPTIYGYKGIKEAIALQLFGGVSKTMPDGSYIRGDVHVLLIGDPGMGKSQVLRYVRNLAPRGVYASGKSSTSAGLTAAAVKDDFGDGKWSLEAGALVLADKGVACIDEVDKMRDDDRSALHEAMEQQSISIAKAGITTTLKTRCALLGAANPKYGRFDRYEPIADQINMEPALLSRFDLIFTLTDQPSEDLDSKIANHILGSHRGGQLIRKDREDEATFDEVDPPIDPELMKKYVAMAKNVVPVISDEAMEKLRDFYVSLRNVGEGDSPVPVTARQLEALVRLAEASTRIRLEEVVEEDDASRAIRIVKNCLKEVGMDPETEEYDIDVLATGVSKSQRDKIRMLKDIIRDLEAEHGGKAPKERVYEEADEAGIPKGDVKGKIQMMKNDGELYSPDHDHLKLA